MTHLLPFPDLSLPRPHHSGQPRSYQCFGSKTSWFISELCNVDLQCNYNEEMSSHPLPRLIHPAYCDAASALIQRYDSILTIMPSGSCLAPLHYTHYKRLLPDAIRSYWLLYALPSQVFTAKEKLKIHQKTIVYFLIMIRVPDKSVHKYSSTWLELVSIKPTTLHMQISQWNWLPSICDLLLYL